MTEQFLSKEEMEGLYKAGFASFCDDDEGLEKIAAGSPVDVVSQPFSLVKDVGNTAKDVVVSIPKLLLWLMGTGVAFGGLGGIAYNVTKNRLAGEAIEKEDEANKIREIYENKNREMEDSMWMDSARNKRDFLKKEQKHMTPEEYELKYNELSNLLDERKG